MATGSDCSSTLPWWLVHVREVSGCTVRVVHEYSCDVEEHDGIKYRRCKDFWKRVRVCQGREEIISSREVETHEPLIEQPEHEAASALSEQHGSGASHILSPQAGQALDEFFQIAAEIGRELTASGVLPPEDASELHLQQGTKSPGSSGPGFLGRLFSHRSRAAPQEHDKGKPSDIASEYACSIQEV